jgi:hypothetical protein
MRTYDRIAEDPPFPSPQRIAATHAALIARIGPRKIDAGEPNAANIIYSGLRNLKQLTTPKYFPRDPISAYGRSPTRLCQFNSEVIKRNI